jgi:DNA replication and repair protein RecF
MFVKRLVLTHFRNYAALNVSFSGKRIGITGLNGTGKTNVLEALYYLTLGRTFRKGTDADLIQKGQSSATVFLEYVTEKDNKPHSLSCTIGGDYKAFVLDNEKIKSLSKILGKFLAVVYDPSSVSFFKDEPQVRRQLLDETLSQISPDYLRSLTRYRKLLKERNSALLQNYDPDIIAVLRNELINLSYRIVQERKKLNATLSQETSAYYQTLFGEEKKLTLVYKTNAPLDDDQESFVKASLTAFDRCKSLENMRRQTMIGPHRDDWIAYLNQNPLALYGSQGENRLASLSLKLAICDTLTASLQERPVLLLDDVLSDLDEKRSQSLLDTISDKGMIFITGTSLTNKLRGYSLYETNGTNLQEKNI